CGAASQALHTWASRAGNLGAWGAGPMRRALLLPALALSEAAGLAPAAHADTWCGTDAVATDREPEAVSASQIHVVYAFPSDGTDRFSLEAGPIVADIS